MSCVYQRSFAIIQFSQPEGELIPIDFVPGSWISIASDKTYKCKYPPSKFYSKVSKWTKELKEPESSWKSYPVKILAGADYFEQGFKRCSRALSDFHCASTDSENLKKQAHPVVLSDKQTNDILQKTISVAQPKICVASKNLKKNNNEIFRKSKPSHKEDRLLKSKKIVKRAIIDSDDSDSSTFTVNDPQPKSILTENLNGGQNSNYNENRSSIKSSHKSRTNKSFKRQRITESDSDVSMSSVQDNPRPNFTNAQEKEDSNTSDNSCSNSSKNFSQDNSNFGNSDPLVQYFDKKFDELKGYVGKKIRSAKDSILHDVRTKTEGILLNITIMKNNSLPSDINEITNILNAVFPLTTLPEFLSFEEDLKTDEKKKEALSHFFQHLCLTATSPSECIFKSLPRVMNKEVQSNYSGQGTKKKGESKLNFKETVTYSCFEVSVLRKFQNTTDLQKLISKVGKWLSGYKDRDKGRQER